MSNVGNLLLFQGYHSYKDQYVESPVRMYKDQIWFYLDLHLITPTLIDRTGEILPFQEGDDRSNFRLYDTFINNIFLMSKEKVDYILSHQNRCFHSEKTRHENGWLMVDIPVTLDQHRWNVSKIVEGIHSWMYGYSSKRAIGLWLTRDTSMEE